MQKSQTRILPFRRPSDRERSARSTTCNLTEPDLAIAARRLSRLLELRRLIDRACLRAQRELRARIRNASSDHDPTAA